MSFPWILCFSFVQINQKKSVPGNLLFFKSSPNMKPATGLKEGYQQNQAVSISFLKGITRVGLCKGPGI